MVLDDNAGEFFLIQRVSQTSFQVIFLLVLLFSA